PRTGDGASRRVAGCRPTPPGAPPAPAAGPDSRPAGARRPAGAAAGSTVTVRTGPTRGGRTAPGCGVGPAVPTPGSDAGAAAAHRTRPAVPGRRSRSRTPGGPPDGTGAPAAGGGTRSCVRAG